MNTISFCDDNYCGFSFHQDCRFLAYQYGLLNCAKCITKASPAILAELERAQELDHEVDELRDEVKDLKDEVNDLKDKADELKGENKLLRDKIKELGG